MTKRALALLGGEPTFDAPRHVGTPNLGDRATFFDLVERAWSTRWLSNAGPLVRQFEEVLAERLDVAHVVTTSHGTVAIQLIAAALEIRGPVVMPAFTFVATAHAVRWLGLAPAFADVRTQDHTLDAEDVSRLLAKGGRANAEAPSPPDAIMAVDLWGRPADADALGKLAEEAGIPLFFDSSHALGSSWRGRSVARRGLATTFSLHATKVLNTFEGGLIATDDDSLAREVRSRRNFGLDETRTVQRLGTNAKMNEVSAAMGLASLASLDEWIERNRRHHERYAGHLESIPGLRLVVDDADTESNHHYLVIEVDESAFGLSRDALHRVLVAERIMARRYFSPGLHLVPPYADEVPARSLPATEHLSNAALQLPTGPALTDEEIDQVGEVLRAAADRADELKVL